MQTDEIDKIMKDIENLYQEKDKQLDSFKRETEKIKESIIDFSNKYGSRYTFQPEYKRGGGGLIIKMVDTHFDRFLALKISRPKDEDTLKSFENEISFLKVLNLENIIPIYDFGKISNSKLSYYIMPFMKGNDFLEFLNNEINPQKDITKVVKTKKVEEEFENNSNTKKLDNILKVIVRILYRIAKSIKNLHDFPPIKKRKTISSISGIIS